jgi:hypothetical protein
MTISTANSIASAGFEMELSIRISPLFEVLRDFCAARCRPVSDAVEALRHDVQSVGLELQLLLYELLCHR